MSLVENLVKKYDDDFTLQIPRWEIADQGITVLKGPSGAGKTSIFRILIGLEENRKTTWTFKGEDLNRLPIRERRLGVVFQSYDLFPHMTTAENLWFSAHARKVPEARAQKFFDELVLLLKLQPLLNRKAFYLSGGEKQRVALARALMGEPRFLFLDEPFSNLDTELRNEARTLVKMALERFQIPSLLITHDPEDVKILAHHVVNINNGKLV